MADDDVDTSTAENKVFYDRPPDAAEYLDKELPVYYEDLTDEQRKAYDAAMAAKRAGIAAQEPKARNFKRGGFRRGGGKEGSEIVNLGPKAAAAAKAHKTK